MVIKFQESGDGGPAPSLTVHAVADGDISDELREQFGKAVGGLVAWAIKTNRPAPRLQVFDGPCTGPDPSKDGKGGVA